MVKYFKYLLVFISLNSIAQNLKISQLPLVNNLSGSEIIPLAQGSFTKGVTAGNLKTFFFPLYSGTSIKYLADSAGVFSWRTVSGGGGGSYVDLTTAQTVGGNKTFSNGLTIGATNSLNFAGAYGTDVIYGTTVGRTFYLDPNNGGVLATQSWVTANGVVTYNYLIKTSNYTATSLDKFIECTGTMTITLPTAVGVATETHKILNNGSGVVTVVCTGGTTVNVNISFNGDAYEFVSNGTNWKIY